MKTLDLNVYGVHEMNDVEMKNVDGGGLFGALLLVVGLVAAVIGAGQPTFPKAAALGYPGLAVACIGLALI
jgi:hypothetical protein